MLHAHKKQTKKIKYTKKGKAYFKCQGEKIFLDTVLRANSHWAGDCKVKTTKGKIVQCEAIHYGYPHAIYVKKVVYGIDDKVVIYRPINKGWHKGE